MLGRSTVAAVFAAVADVFPTVPAILDAVANILAPISHVLATIASVLDAVPAAAVMQRVATVFHSITDILAAVADVFTAIAHVLATVAHVLAAVAPVLDTVADFATMERRVRGARWGILHLRAHDGRGASHQGRSNGGHSEIAHCVLQSQYPRAPSWRARLIRRRQPLACYRSFSTKLRHILPRPLPARSGPHRPSELTLPALSIKRLPLLTLFLTLAVTPVLAQESAAPVGAAGRQYPIDPETAPRPSTRATRTDRRIEIDGHITEEAWNAAEPLTDFVQQLPNTGALATYPTFVRVLYDDEHLYVSAVCVQNRKDIIIAGLQRDFDSGNSDIFGLTLDTFLDRRNSFLFLVNPGGAIRDEQTFNDSRNIVDAWEGVIRAKTVVTDTAWYAEIAIPFTTLRFARSSNPQDWGVNFVRRVRLVNETSYWAPLDRQYRVHRMSKAGTLTGLEGLTPGRNLTLKPYALAGHSTGSQVPSTSLGARYDGGMDLKYGVTSGLTLDLTTRTDFSQVEVDQEQVNLTRFSTFFPERRDFFIENSGSFSFGDVTERNYRMGASLSDFTLFQSRRIGLTNDGRPISILGGGRLTGRAGPYELGVINMQTDDFEGATTTPAENFTAARVKRNIFGKSDIGVEFLNRQATGGGGAYNRSWGADANIRLFDVLVINSYIAGSEAPGGRSDGTAGRLSIAWRDRFWDASTFYKRVDDTFDPGMGFLRRRAMEHTFGTVGFHARPAIPHVQEVNPYVSAHYITNLDRLLETRTLAAGVSVAMQPDGFLDAEVRDFFERVPRAFEIFPGDTILAGAYSWREATAGYTTSAARALSGNLRVTAGDFYDGSRTSVGAGATWRPRFDVLMELSLQRNQVDLPRGAFDADVAGLRVRYSWSTALFGSAFVQYNAESKQLVTNARINFRYAPLSDVFLVYTDRRNQRTDSTNERSIAIKATKLVAF
jgi:hypothetical protein